MQPTLKCLLIEEALIDKLIQNKNFKLKPELKIFYNEGSLNFLDKLGIENKLSVV